MHRLFCWFVHFHLETQRPIAKTQIFYIIRNHNIPDLLLPDRPSQDATYPAPSESRNKRSKETKNILQFNSPKVQHNQKTPSILSFYSLYAYWQGVPHLLQTFPLITQLSTPADSHVGHLTPGTWNLEKNIRLIFWIGEKCEYGISHPAWGNCGHWSKFEEQIDGGSQLRVEWREFLDVERDCGRITTISGSWLTHFKNIRISGVLEHACAGKIQMEGVESWI